jgi:D-3-phosphoglycerate dehydrogenase
MNRATLNPVFLLQNHEEQTRAGWALVEAREDVEGVPFAPLPKTPETTGLFDAARLAHMKRTAFIVNTARGGIIDEKALYDALKANRIAGAALDVFDQEPTPQDNPLLILRNFIAAPHVAGVTREAVDRMGIAAVENILSVLDGKPIRDNVVNREVLD